ncbi:MAG TPA: hypothetical protein VGK37_12420 [Casimicrobiaceae bacterium]|jgi:hypothetical protein
MKRRYLAQALVVVSLGALAATGYAQTNRSGTGTTAGSYGTTTGTVRAPMTDADIAAYNKAGAACDNGPAAQHDQCWVSLYTHYRVDSDCQKLTGNAFVSCVRGGVRPGTGGKLLPDVQAAHSAPHTMQR